MRENIDSLKEQQKPLENVSAEFDSREEAVRLIRQFWESMPHGHDILANPESKTDEYWSEQLTMGDRTSLIDGKYRRKNGKWIVLFAGNHQPLTNEAVSWLRERGLIAE